MNEGRTVSVTKQLSGTVVLDADTTRTRGYVTDVSINPATGTRPRRQAHAIPQLA
jgi:hypothetical protein